MRLSPLTDVVSGPEPYVTDASFVVPLGTEDELGRKTVVTEALGEASVDGKGRMTIPLEVKGAVRREVDLPRVVDVALASGGICDIARDSGRDKKGSRRS